MDVERPGGMTVRLVLLLFGVLAIAFVAYAVWSAVTYEASMRDKVLAEARTLSIEIQASWDYIDAMQSRINYNSDGRYDFKGVYCSVAGKNIAQRFSAQSDGYVIRYVRENPRSGGDEPDEFEATALTDFAANGTSEYYDIVSADERVFRYVSALEIRPGCLTCHGAPAGEKDETGYLKEGFSVGDIAGATSIVIPLDRYEAESFARFAQTVVFFIVLMAALVGAAHVAIAHFVTAPLQRANEQLRLANQTQSNFLSIMNHELRTPLTAIVTYTDVWEKDVGGKSPGDEVTDAGLADEAEIVRGVRENSQVLLGMVNNTIDMARIEAGRYEIVHEDVDLADVVGAVKSLVQPVARRKGIVLAFDVEPHIPVVSSDWEALRKILSNLVTNALKYTPSGKRVTVSIGFAADLPGASSDRGIPAGAAPVAGTLTICVLDEGVGIPESDLGRIFERFSQASGGVNTHGKDGSGLGLTIVKNLTELLGGRVEVRSEVGRGSEFTVRLPVSAAGTSEIE